MLRVNGSAAAVLFLLSLSVPAGASAAEPFARGMVTISLDDGWATQFELARPLLAEYGYPATFYVVTDAVRQGWAVAMTLAQVRQLAAEGHEIASHTLSHPNLTKVGDAQLQAELSASQDWLVANLGLPDVAGFASPYGAYDARVLAAVRPLYRSHRTVNRVRMFRDSDPYALGGYDVVLGTSVAEVQAWIDQALTERSWLILLFHELTTGVPERSTQLGVPELRAVLEHLRLRDADVVTVAEGISRLSPSTTPVTSLPVYGDSLESGFVDWSWASRDLAQRAVVHGGSAAIAFEPDRWAGLDLHHPGLDAARWTGAELWVHGGTSGGQAVTFRLCRGGSVLGQLPLSTALGGPVAPGVWQRVTIPFASLGVTSGTFDALVLQAGTAADQPTLYVDDLRLTSSVAPPPPPPPAPGLVIYADALEGGFRDFGWAVHDLAQTAVVHGGTAAASFEPDAWRGLYFQGPAIDVSRFAALELWVHGGATGGQAIMLRVARSGTLVGQTLLSTALARPIAADAWQRVSVPLASLGLASGTFDALYLQAWTAADQARVHVDDVRLVPR